MLEDPEILAKAYERKRIEQDLAIRLQQAEQRRASDQARRQAPAHNPRIAKDTVLLLSEALCLDEPTVVYAANRKEVAHA